EPVTSFPAGLTKVAPAGASYTLRTVTSTGVAGGTVDGVGAPPGAEPTGAPPTAGDGAQPPAITATTAAAASIDPMEFRPRRLMNLPEPCRIAACRRQTLGDDRQVSEPGPERSPGVLLRM